MIPFTDFELMLLQVIALGGGIILFAVLMYIVHGR